MTDKEIAKLEAAVGSAHKLIADAAALGITQKVGTPISKAEAEKNSLLDEIRSHGMNPIIQEVPIVNENGGEIVQLCIRLLSEIEWHNSDGSVTILEEHCYFGNLEGFEDQCRWYIANAERYTNFVN